MIDLRLGDCLEIMKTIPDKSIDLVLTDPPYGLDFRDNDWDNYIPKWIDEARRIGKLVIFTTAPTTQWDYPRPDWVLCWYREASNARNYAGGFNHWSPVLIYGKIKFAVDCIKLHSIANAYPKGFPHPSPKPLKLMRWIIETATEVNTILDPFMGSGTTGVACKELGRSFIGIEIEPKYFEIAKRRIDNTMENLL